jgi:hypothetical protein
VILGSLHAFLMAAIGSVREARLLGHLAGVLQYTFISL